MERGADWAAQARDGVVYMRLDGMLTEAIVDATRRLQVLALRQRPDGIGIVLDIGESPQLPPADVRDYATKMAARFPQGIVVHVTVLGGEGFRASALRSALTGIFLFARSPYRRLVVDTPAEAIRLVRTHLGAGAPPPGSMMSAFDEVRAALRAA